MASTTLILISGIVSGCILFQSAVLAPILFKHLTVDQARPILRALFPVLFCLMILLSLVFTAIAFQFTSIIVAVGITSALLSGVCLWLVPKTNAAADADNNQLFVKLHTASVVLTLLVLLLNLSWSFVLL